MCQKIWLKDLSIYTIIIKMQFEKKDLLTFAEIKIMITSIFPNEKSEIIHNKLINYCFISDKGILYALQKNITYLKISDI